MDAEWVGAVVALLVAACTAAAWLTARAWKVLRQVVHFLDDWRGQPAHDGVPERPGVLARLGTVEQLLDHVVAETRPNHGQSLRDMVSRTAADVAEVRADQAAMRTKIDTLDAAVKGKR